MATQNDPPSKGGPIVQLWDRDFNLIYDNRGEDTTLADLTRLLEQTTVTIDDDTGRHAKRVHSVKFHNFTNPPTLLLGCEPDCEPIPYLPVESGGDV